VPTPKRSEATHGRARSDLAVAIVCPSETQANHAVAMPLGWLAHGTAAGAFFCIVQMSMNARAATSPTRVIDLRASVNTRHLRADLARMHHKGVRRAPVAEFRVRRTCKIIDFELLKDWDKSHGFRPDTQAAVDAVRRLLCLVAEGGSLPHDSIVTFGVAREVEGGTATFDEHKWESRVSCAVCVEREGVTGGLDVWHDHQGAMARSVELSPGYAALFLPSEVIHERTPLIGGGHAYRILLEGRLSPM
jgi:hypothetical protein